MIYKVYVPIVSRHKTTGHEVKYYFAVNIRPTGAKIYTLQTIMCNYSLTKALTGTTFQYPSKPDTILNSPLLCRPLSPRCVIVA